MNIITELNEIEQFARERYIPVMLDDTKELLFSIVKAAKPRRILEIGTGGGVQRYRYAACVPQCQT